MLSAIMFLGSSLSSVTLYIFASISSRPVCFGHIINFKRQFILQKVLARSQIHTEMASCGILSAFDTGAVFSSFMTNCGQSYKEDLTVAQL